jgi:hypothetical protein
LDPHQPPAIDLNMPVTPPAAASSAGSFSFVAAAAAAVDWRGCPSGSFATLALDASFLGLSAASLCFSDG